MFASRFRLPSTLTSAVDGELLAESLSLLADISPDVVAFHGTSGSWTGIRDDAELAERLADRAGASRGTTATQATLAALDELKVSRIGVVFPGTDEIVAAIGAQFALRDIEVVSTATLPVNLTNPEIAELRRADIASLIESAFAPGVDAVVCVGTNLRSGYCVAELERKHGVVVIDSALALAWHALRLSGRNEAVAGWGGLLGSH